MRGSEVWTIRVQICVGGGTGDMSHVCEYKRVCVGGGTGDMSHVCEYKRVRLVERKESMQLTKFRVHFTFQLYREDNNKTKLTHTHWHTIIITTDEGFVSWLGNTLSS